MMEESITLRDVLIVLFKHKYKILTVFVMTVATVTVGAFGRPPVYEATSTLLIKFGREYLYRPEVGEGRAVVNAAIHRDRAALTGSEIEILTSRDLMAQVMTTLGADNLYAAGRDLMAQVMTTLGADNLYAALSKSLASDQTPMEMEQVVDLFENNLSVERRNETDVVRVSFRHEEPHMAAKVVNTLVDAFKEKRLRIYKDPKASPFLKKQVAVYRQRLQEAEEKHETFQQTYRVFAYDEQRKLLLSQRMESDAALKAAQGQVAALQQKLFSLDKRLPTIAENVPLTTEPDTIIADAKSRVLTLQLQEKQLLSKFKEGHPRVSSIRKELQLAEAFLKEREATKKGRVTIGKNVIYEDIKRDMIKIEADLQSEEAKIAVFRQQRDQLDQELHTLTQREKTLHHLQRELARNENFYQMYVNKLEETRVSDAMDRQKIANISTIQTATVPVKPVSRGRRVLIALGVVLGAFAGVGLAFFTEYIGQVMSTPERVEKRLDLPVLATVPYSRQRLP